MKMGLECEFFLVDEDNKPQVISGDLQSLPHDECGWLVEARGKPFNSIVEAVYSLKASIYEIQLQLDEINARRLAPKKPLKLSSEPIMKIDRAVRVFAARTFGKPLISYQNLYGYQHHRNAQSEATAGVHISFTCEGTIYHKDGVSQTYNKNFDWAQIFVTLDSAFKDEIKTAKRRPGFYEIKEDGRIEYRSLPSNVDLDKIIKVVREMF